MYEIKRQIYGEFSKTQKAALCNFLKAFVKKNPEAGTDEILEKFLSDERYYFEIDNPHFEFLAELLDDEKFLSETRLFVAECIKFFEYKKAQAPVIAAQKAFEKKKREFLREVKMSKETPTKKQLYYYKTLCDKYKQEPKELTSKLEARDEIRKIIDEHTRDYQYLD